MNTSQIASASAFLLAAAKWAVENDIFLDDFVHRYPLPHLALVTKGQYLTIGAPNVANPALKPYVLVHSRQKVRKVLAQLVRVKDGKRKVLTENKVAVPESYQGYFDILSEDGKPVKAIESVHELCQKFPEQCLVRQSCKAYLPDGDGELRSLYRTRTVQESEVLTLVGQFNFKRVVFLRCFDELGASVYLKLNQKGKFSPIAAQEHITGVHSIENLINKRLPLTVRLVQGRSPSEFQKITGSNSLVLQLNTVYLEDIVYIYSLQKDQGQLLAVPLKTHLKLAPALNHQHVRRSDEFDDIVDRCQEVLAEVSDKMVIVNDHELVYRPLSPDQKLNPNPTEKQQKSTDTQVCDEEIDQLYDYIRGLAPPPEVPTKPPGVVRSHGKQTKKTTSPTHRKPPPPPIETIPSRKSADSGRVDHRHVLKIEEISGDEDGSAGNSPITGIVTEPKANFSRSPDRTSPSSTTKTGPKSNRSTQERARSGSGITSSERRKRLSKSTEKLPPFVPGPQFAMPMSFGPHANHVYRPGVFEERSAPASNGKRRPFSMVIPDNVPLPPPRHPYPIPLLPPYRHPHFTNGLLANYQSRMYQSAANLNGAHEENEVKSVPPSPFGMNYGVGRTPLYPRYAPGYYQPMYRV